MKPYLLLTPGPLTTSETVKEAMMTDWCTWDADYNVHIVEEIRKSLVALATTATNEYTSVLLQGSGTYCVEAVIGSVITPKHKLLILSNGAYGDRMGHIAEYHGIIGNVLFKSFFQFILVVEYGFALYNECAGVVIFLYRFVWLRGR